MRIIGGTLRGLTVLAAANLLWFVLLVLGGVALGAGLLVTVGAARAVAGAPTAEQARAASIMPRAAPSRRS